MKDKAQLIIENIIVQYIYKDLNIGFFTKIFKKNKLNNIKQIVRETLTSFKQENNIEDLSKLFHSENYTENWAKSIGEKIIKNKHSSSDASKTQKNYIFHSIVAGITGMIFSFYGMHRIYEIGKNNENINRYDERYIEINDPSFLMALASIPFGFSLCLASFICIGVVASRNIISKISSIFTANESTNIDKKNNGLYKTFSKVGKYFNSGLENYSEYLNTGSLLNIIENTEVALRIRNDNIKNILLNEDIDSLTLKQLSFIDKTLKDTNNKYMFYDNLFTPYRYITTCTNKIAKVIQGLFESVEDYRIEDNEKRDYTLSYKEITTPLANLDISSNIAKYLSPSWGSRIRETCKKANVLGL